MSTHIALSLRSACRAGADTSGKALPAWAAPRHAAATSGMCAGVADVPARRQSARRQRDVRCALADRIGGKDEANQVAPGKRSAWLIYFKWLMHTLLHERALFPALFGLRNHFLHCIANMHVESQTDTRTQCIRSSEHHVW